MTEPLTAAYLGSEHLGEVIKLRTFEYEAIGELVFIQRYDHSKRTEPYIKGLYPSGKEIRLGFSGRGVADTLSVDGATRVELVKKAPEIETTGKRR
jgi:hypothetical protein